MSKRRAPGICGAALLCEEAVFRRDADSPDAVSRAGGAGPYEVVAIVGPTASGKSDLADELAARLGSEVVSADAMQVYRRMDVGTAKTPPDGRRAPLRCVDLAEPGEAYSVALYAREAHAVIDAACAAGRMPVVCGGTGLYVRAALEEMDFPAGGQTGNPVRERYARLAEELGPEEFHRRLAAVDPASAALIHHNNVRRVVRAFELLEQGTSYACEHETLHVRTDRHPTLYVGLSVPREALYARIDARVDRMVASGLLDEVAELAADGFADALTARQAIGYKEFLKVLDGTCSLTDAVEEVKRATRRYAKRQMTWFRADGRIRWLDAEPYDASLLCTAVLDMIGRSVQVVV